MTDKYQKSSYVNGNNFNNCTTSMKNNCNNKAALRKDQICRDYLNGMCKRQICRYPHVSSCDSIIFCHDYQNAGCSRAYCKFLHYTLKEEDYYKQFGKFPEPMLSVTQGFDSKEVIPKRKNEYSNSIHCQLHSPPLKISRLSRENVSHPSPMWSNNTLQLKREYRDEYIKMNRLNCSNERLSLETSPQCKSFQSFTNLQNNNETSEYYKDIVAVMRRFDEEQNMLRRRVEMNEIKIAELRSNNEYLLVQNAQLCLQNHVKAQQLRCSATQDVTQSTSVPQTVMTATPIVSIATPQTQIITSSGTPLAISAANTSQAQQLAITQQNITTLSNANQSGILSSSQITLAPAITQGATMELTINTSQPLSISNTTQPIISYPVMAHSMLPH